MKWYDENDINEHRGMGKMVVVLVVDAYCGRDYYGIVIMGMYTVEIIQVYINRSVRGDNDGIWGGMEK